MRISGSHSDGYKVLYLLDLTSCSPLKAKSSACYLLQDGILLGVFLAPENGGNMFLQNFG
jgi:hypothetical protein